MEPNEGVALPAMDFPLEESQVGLPPVYFFGITPAGRDGKEYNAEVQEERSKPHWLELMNKGLNLASEQQRQGRRVNVKKVALTPVEEENKKGGQFVRKDYDQSSPGNKRKETLLDITCATESLHEVIKTFRKKLNKETKSLDKIDLDEIDLDEIDLDEQEVCLLLEALDDKHFGNTATATSTLASPDTVLDLELLPTDGKGWDLGLPTDGTVVESAYKAE
jgi:hypothetical protein